MNMRSGSFWAAVAALVGIPGALVALVQLGAVELSPTAAADDRSATAPAPTAPSGGAGGGGLTTTTGAPETTSGGDPGACVITITHFGADLKAEPDHTSRTVSGIDERPYTVLDSAISTFAGVDEQWFQIEVDGRVGWVVDLPILLEKSSSCA